MELAHDYEELTAAIEKATKFILNNEVPTCDYTKSTDINRSLSISEDADEYSRDLVQIFRNAVRKARVLNRRSELKLYKLYELISKVRHEKRKTDDGTTILAHFNPMSEFAHRLLTKKPTISLPDGIKPHPLPSENPLSMLLPKISRPHFSRKNTS